MKRLLILLALGFLSIPAYSQVNRIPMFEHFTNASCPPCAFQNPIMDAFLDGQTSEYVRVSHQGAWPGADVMNAEYPQGPVARTDFYGITGHPSLVLNGTDLNGLGNLNQTVFDNAAALMTPLSISIDQIWNVSGSITVNIDIENVTATDYNAGGKLFVTMLEDLIHISNPNAGTTNEVDFHSVMRQMYNASTGVSDATTGLDLGIIAANSTVNFNFDVNAIPNYIRDINQISFAAYIKSNTNNSIEQAGKSTAGGASGLNTSAESSSTWLPDYCDYSFSPSIEITNNDIVNITSASLQYNINDGVQVSLAFNGTILPGESASISFPDTILTGLSIIKYTVNTVNGSSGYVNPNAMIIEAEQISKVSGISNSSLTEDFENATDRSFNSGFFDVSNAVSTNNFKVFDGIGFSSSKSLLFRFFELVNATEPLNVVFEGVNLGANSKLKFNRAHARYQTSNDALEIFISNDCGNNWTSLWNKSGASLANRPATDNEFGPSVDNHWVADSVDLSLFDGFEDVIVKFVGTSNYGNNLFLDNINVTFDTPEPSINSLSSILNTQVQCEDDSTLITLSFTNNGNIPIHNLSLNKTLNEGVTENEVIELSSSLAIGATTSIEVWVTNPQNGALNTVEFDIIEINGLDNSLNIQSSSVNFLSINSFTSSTNIGQLIIQFDEYPEQTTWSLYDETLDFEVFSSNTVSPGVNELYTDYFTLFEDHCYKFELSDQNGLCCNNGNGYYDFSIDNISISNGSFFQGLQQSKFRFKHDPSLSINESVINEFEIYPNPAANEVSVTSKMNHTIEDIQILNTMGQSVSFNQKNSLNENGQITLNISDLPSGSYWIRVQSENSVWTEQLIISK